MRRRPAMRRRFLPHRPRRRPVPAAGREQFVPLMVDCFAQKASTPSTLAGAKVEVADRARTTNITVVGWTHGQVVVIVWANGVRATQQIAQQYVSQNP